LGGKEQPQYFLKKMPVPNQMRSFTAGKSPLEFMTGKPVKVEK